MKYKQTAMATIMSLAGAFATTQSAEAVSIQMPGGKFDCTKLDKYPNKKLFNMRSIGGFPREILEQACKQAEQVCQAQAKAAGRGPRCSR